jgi:hypothetical protein
LIARARALLEHMNKPGFWNRRTEAEHILADYRKLDVAARAEERIAQPLLALGEIVSRAEPLTIEQMARAVERAARAHNDWEDRVSEEGPGHCWLLLRNQDASEAADTWIAELTEMLLAWSRRLHLSAEVVAFGIDYEKLARTVLAVEGRVRRAT